MDHGALIIGYISLHFDDSKFNVYVVCSWVPENETLHLEIHAFELIATIKESMYYLLMAV